jgi:hypothetical protein
MPKIQVQALREYPSWYVAIMMLDIMVLENVRYFNLLFLPDDDTGKFNNSYFVKS